MKRASRAGRAAGGKARSRNGLGVVRVFPRPGAPQRGTLRAGPLALPCALGRGGVTHMKREGDGATPAGRHRLLRLLVRRDRLAGPATLVPSTFIKPDDGWCEDPGDGRYNSLVRLTPGSHADRLTREDRLYDIVGILDWNLRPRIAGRGSAIFLHLCRPGFGPTAGCIALEPRDLTLLLARLGRAPEFAVAASPRKRRSTAPSGGRPT
jgi:L,D-peptidoglycan transpeptidase YkuD (ErfK/YbiS/YcfS/YnhG family)